ncbi:MAG TPA: hypothetical protein VFS66_05915 [Acidimicrobiia bacterium]|nr:hypothetical protein [Acidimicrobiia bacterium]
MRKRITILLAAVAMALAVALPASAAGPVPGGIACQSAGIGVLTSVPGLMPAVAQNGVDVYADEALETLVGNFSLSETLALHRSTPSLFSGGLYVDVFGTAVEANWCG